MKRSVLAITLLLTVTLLSNKLFAQAPAAAPAASPTMDIVGTLGSADNGNVNVAAFLVKAANIGSALQAAGPFTVFAPTNEAFTKLPSGKLDSLLSDPAKLATVLKMHVVVGKFSKADIVKALNASADRKATFKTIDGGTLTLSFTIEKKLVLTDEHGNSADLLLYNIQATNGVIQGLDGVL